MRRSLPKAFGVIRGPGGLCRRLYSAMSTRRVTRVDELGVEPGGDELATGAVALDVGLEERVEHLVGRERLVVALVGTQLGRRRLREHRLGHDLAAGRPRSRGGTARTRAVLGTSLITAKPPAVSP